MMAVLNTFTGEKVIVQKERKSRAYSLSAYFLAKILSEIPYNIIGPIIFSSICYWIVQLNPDP